MVKDPVCGMELDPEKAVTSCTYQGETYYFCAEICRDEFVKDPKKFLDKRGRGCCCH